MSVETQSDRLVHLAAASTVHVSFFRNYTDTRLSGRKDMPLGDLALALSEHAVRADKDGPMLALARYADGATRGNAGVLVATGFVMDVDEIPDWPLLDLYQYFAYTTHSHQRKKRNAWRIILPSGVPIAPGLWDEAWLRVSVRLVPNADPGAKPLSQPHYLPSCQPGTTPEVRHHEGAWLDWTRLDPLPPSPTRQRRAPGQRCDRPGDDYAAQADWADILEPAGGRHVYTRRDGTELWRRPGKDRGWSATLNYQGCDCFFPFTSNWPPFAPRTSYTKFGAYALLHHAGDFHAAAHALAAEGYGSPGTFSETSGIPSRLYVEVA